MCAIRVDWGYSVVADVEFEGLAEDAPDEAAGACAHFCRESTLRCASSDDHNGAVVRRNGSSVGVRGSSASALVLQQHVVRRVKKSVVVEVWMDPHDANMDRDPHRTEIITLSAMPSGAALSHGRRSRKSDFFEMSCGGVHAADLQLVAACDTFYHVRMLCMRRGSRKRLIRRKRELHPGSTLVGVASTGGPWVEWSEGRQWHYSTLAEGSVTIHEGVAGNRCVGLKDVTDCDEVVLLKHVTLDMPLVASLASTHDRFALPVPTMCSQSVELMEFSLELVRHSMRLICACELPFEKMPLNDGLSPASTPPASTPPASTPPASTPPGRLLAVDTCFVSSVSSGAVQFSRCLAAQRDGSPAIDIVLSRVEPTCLLALASKALKKPSTAAGDGGSAGVVGAALQFEDNLAFRDSLAYHHEHNFARVVFRALQSQKEVALDEVRQAQAACSEFGMTIDLSLLCSVVACGGPPGDDLRRSIDAALSAAVATMFLPVPGTDMFVLSPSAILDNSAPDGASSSRPAYWERCDAFPDALERQGGSREMTSAVPEWARSSRCAQAFEDVKCEPCFVRFQLRAENGLNIDCGPALEVMKTLTHLGVDVDIRRSFHLGADEDDDDDDDSGTCFEGPQVVLRMIGATLPDAAATTHDGSAIPLCHARVFGQLRKRLCVIVESCVLELMLRVKLSTVVVELVREGCLSLPPALVSCRYMPLEFVYPEVGMRMFAQELVSSTQSWPSLSANDEVFTAFREVFVVGSAGGSLPYWLFVTLTDAGVHIVLHHPPNSLAAARRDAIFERIRGVLLRVNHLVNQVILLNVLNDVRVASALLIPPSVGDPDEASEVLPEPVLSTGSGAGRAGLSKRLTFRAGRARDRGARRVNSEFAPGQFSCPLQGVIRVRLFERTATNVAVLRQVLSTQALGMFVITNRSDMFVYSSKESPIFYMRLLFDSELSDARSSSDVGSTSNTAVKTKGFVKLELFGVYPASTQVLDGLRRSIERCVADLNLQLLSVLLARSAQFHIPTADARFIQPAGLPPNASLMWRLPDRVVHPEALVEMMIDSFGGYLGPLNFLADDGEDSERADVVSSSVLARQEQDRADGVGACHPVHGGSAIRLVRSTDAHPAVQGFWEPDMWMASPLSLHPACLSAVQRHDSASAAVLAITGRSGPSVVSPACVGYFATAVTGMSERSPSAVAACLAARDDTLRPRPAAVVVERLKYCFNYRPSGGGVDDVSEVVGRGISFVYITLFKASIPDDSPRDESYMAKVVGEGVKAHWSQQRHVSATVAPVVTQDCATEDPLSYRRGAQSDAPFLANDAAVLHPAAREASFVLVEAWAPQHAARMNIEALVRRAGVSLQQVLVSACARGVVLFDNVAGAFRACA